MRVSNKIFQIAKKNHKYALSFLYQNVYNPLNNNAKVSLVLNAYMKKNFNIMSIKKNLPWLKLINSKDGSQKK